MIPREQGEVMTGRTFDFETELDEMHSAVLSVLPEKLLDLTDISATREGIEELFSQMPAFAQPADVSIEEVQVPGLNGDPDVRVKVYKPTSLPS